MYSYFQFTTCFRFDDHCFNSYRDQPPSRRVASACVVRYNTHHSTGLQSSLTVQTLMRRRRSRNHHGIFLPRFRLYQTLLPRMIALLDHDLEIR